MVHTCPGTPHALWPRPERHALYPGDDLGHPPVVRRHQTPGRNRSEGRVRCFLGFVGRHQGETQVQVRRCDPAWPGGLSGLQIGKNMARVRLGRRVTQPGQRGSHVGVRLGRVVPKMVFRPVGCAQPGNQARDLAQSPVGSLAVSESRQGPPFLCRCLDESRTVLGCDFLCSAGQFSGNGEFSSRKPFPRTGFQAPAGNFSVLGFQRSLPCGMSSCRSVRQFSQVDMTSASQQIQPSDNDNQPPVLAQRLLGVHQFRGESEMVPDACKEFLSRCGRICRRQIVYGRLQPVEGVPADIRCGDPKYPIDAICSTHPLIPSDHLGRRSPNTCLVMPECGFRVRHLSRHLGQRQSGRLPRGA